VFIPSLSSTPKTKGKRKEKKKVNICFEFPKLKS